MDDEIPVFDSERSMGLPVSSEHKFLSEVNKPRKVESRTLKEKLPVLDRNEKKSLQELEELKEVPKSKDEMCLSEILGILQEKLKELDKLKTNTKNERKSLEESLLNINEDIDLLKSKVYVSDKELQKLKVENKKESMNALKLNEKVNEIKNKIKEVGNTMEKQKKKTKYKFNETIKTNRAEVDKLNQRVIQEKEELKILIQKEKALELELNTLVVKHNTMKEKYKANKEKEMNMLQSLKSFGYTLNHTQQHIKT